MALGWISCGTAYLALNCVVNPQKALNRLNVLEPKVRQSRAQSVADARGCKKGGVVSGGGRNDRPRGERRDSRLSAVKVRYRRRDGRNASSAYPKRRGGDVNVEIKLAGSNFACSGVSLLLGVRTKKAFGAASISRYPVDRCRHLSLIS